MRELKDDLAGKSDAELDRRETTAAVREGLADVAAGRTTPWDEFDRDFRERHGLSKDS